MLEIIIFASFFRQKALIPSAFFGLQQCLIKFDQACYQYLQASLDYLISAVILLTLCIVLFVGSLFLLLQVNRSEFRFVFSHSTVFRFIKRAYI